jgi:glycosyltransferase involved in cell wall biosynthesis
LWEAALVNDGGFEISAVLPAFNEEANVVEAVTRVAAALRSNATRYEVVVVDDGSRDDTPRKLEELAAREPALRVVRHDVNRGYGAALRSGFDAARYRWVFMMDCDNQFDPAEISVLLASASNADIVAGYRRHRRDPLLRRLNALAFFTLVRLMFGRLARDVNCAFKLIRRDLLLKLDLRSDGALINTEFLVLAGRAGARLVEVPVHHFPRRAGQQTGANPRVVLRAFRELYRFRGEVSRR